MSCDKKDWMRRSTSWVTGDGGRRKGGSQLVEYYRAGGETVRLDMRESIFNFIFHVLSRDSAITIPLA